MLLQFARTPGPPAGPQTRLQAVEQLRASDSISAPGSLSVIGTTCVTVSREGFWNAYRVKASCSSLLASFGIHSNPPTPGQT